MKKLCLFLAMAAVLSLLWGCAPEKTPGASPEVMPIEGVVQQPYYTDPPDVSVVCGEIRLEPRRLTTSWYYAKGDSWSGYNACSMHPLELGDRLEAVQVAGHEARLECAWEPQGIQVRCWPEACLGDSDAEPVELTVSEGSFPLLSGSYVYEVRLSWEGERCRGDANYCFWAVSPQ